jgi:hypothetical protein
MSKLRSGLANDRRRYGCYCEKTPMINIGIVSGQGSIYYGNFNQVTIPGSLYHAGATYIVNTLDDGDVHIPMANIVFNFFGTNFSNNLYWASNNALIFGTPNPNLEVNIPRNLLPSILIGNYDRVLKTFYYTNSVTTNYSITILRVTFYDYYTNTISDSTYQYQIRLIKENVGYQRQFVEVYVISSPPSAGYSTAINSYPSGSNANGNPIDSNGNPIDSTKNSPYNITNGTIFLNPCGSTYSTSSPIANTSFVFSSDSTGTSWVFNNNSHVSV